MEMTGFLKTFILFPDDSFNKLTLPAISVGAKLRTQTTLSFPFTVFKVEIEKVVSLKGVIVTS